MTDASLFDMMPSNFPNYLSEPPTERDREEDRKREKKLKEQRTKDREE